MLVGTAKRERKKANRELARQAQDRSRRLSVLRRRGLIAGIGVPLVVLALFGLARLQDDGDGASVVTTTTLGGSTLIGDTPCPAATGEQRVSTFEKAPPMCIDEKKSYTATMSTSEGDIVIELDTKNTPKTVNNFVVLSRYKYYDDSFIFRTDPGLDIIQGGGSNNTDNPGYTIEDEGSGYKYSEGQIAMARTGEPNSAGGQFFIITGPNAAALDGQGTYVVFGQIAEGLDVAKAIIALNSGSGELGGAPSREVKISKVTITES